MFYKERSDLAWLYSAFGLANADQSLRTDHTKESGSILECLDIFDSWHLWFWYRMGIICLWAAAAEFGLAFISTRAGALSSRAPFAGGQLDKLIACGGLASLIIVGAWVRVVLKRRDAKCVPRRKIMAGPGPRRVLSEEGSAPRAAGL